MAAQEVVFVNPNLVLLKRDLFTTGIVYMPFGLAHLVGSVRASDYECLVIDAFGDKPNQHWVDGDFIYRGLQSSEVAGQIQEKRPEPPLAVFIYAINMTSHQSTISIIAEIRKHHEQVPITVVENSQAVTAYALESVQAEFYEAGADFIIMGEPEHRSLWVLEVLKTGAPRSKVLEHVGIGYIEGGQINYSLPKTNIPSLDILPLPAWDLFPVENYWRLKYSHGPLSASKYLPLLTSRGCPYPCRFCVIPKTNNLKWRSRSARHVVDEMQHWNKVWGIEEFHIEDVDPTVNEKRTRELCEEIIGRELKIRWKISSGTKVETIRKIETIDLMARAGCKYISISPESGSPRVMKLINKPFNYDHAIRLIAAMNQHGIRSQACFVLGFPGEDDADRKLTRNMVYDLTKAGVSEIALFIITPVPGSDICDTFDGYSNYSELNFSPTWRKDYETLNKFRVKLYRDFLLWKFWFHPFTMMKQPINFLRRRFETKMEMVPYRALHTKCLVKGLLT